MCSRSRASAGRRLRVANSDSRGMIRIGLFLLLASSPVFAAPGEREYRTVQTSKELKIEQLRNEEIRAVKTALGLRNPENRKVELYLRLAELYLEAYQADFLLEGRIHDKKLEKNPAARLERGRSKDDLRNGIGAAETILGFQKNSPKLDRILYFLGYNYAEYGDDEKSRTYYRRLIREFPSSGYATDALRAMADSAFQAGDFGEAEHIYEDALRKAEEPAQQARILHKLAWCYYREGKSEKAVATMKRAISVARSGGGGEKLLSVREEGLRDLAIYYAETGKVEEALDYFKENAGEKDKLLKALEKLGKEYERTGQIDKAKLVYEVLLQTDPHDEASFRVAAKMVDLDLLKENFDVAAERLRKLAIPKSKDPDTVLAIVNLRRQVRSTAVNNHERFRRMDGKKEGLRHLEVADQFYSIYLGKFVPFERTGRNELNEIRMYLAEVKAERGEPGAAAELYKKIIQDRDEKYAKDAAQRWVGSLAKELKRRAAAGEKPGSGPSDYEKDFVEASDLLEKSIPASIESREARLRSAQILAAYAADKPDAIKRAKSLALTCPETPQGVLAARLWLQLDPSRPALEAVAGNPRLMAADRAQKGELAKDVESVAKTLEVNEISGYEKDKEYGKAAKAYEQFARNAKTEKEAESAYMGALSSYAQNGNSDEVNRVMKEWRSRFPKSRLLERSVKEEATRYFIRGNFNDSAELFLGLGKMIGDRSSFLTSAALFSGGLHHKKAEMVYRYALSVSGTAEERAEIFKLLALNAIDVRDDAGVILNWKECSVLESSLRAECLCQIGNYLASKQEWKPARERFESVVAIRNGPSASSPYLAYAQFRIAQILERELKNFPLEFPEEKLLKAFEARISELKPVSEAYQKAIDFGGPWGIAATERLGDLSGEFSSEVLRAANNAKASASLKNALIPTADALGKQAVDHAKTAYDAALRQEMLSPALPVIQDRLVDAGIPGTGRAQGSRNGVKLIGTDPDGGKAGREEAIKKVREDLLKSQDNALAWIDYGNLLWGLSKPGLSRIAYERSLALRTRAADAQNNVAVVLVSDLGYENWFAVNEAVALWKKSLAIEPKNSAALFNLGHFYNYYRLFQLALPPLLKVSKRIKIGEVYDALGVAYGGLGKRSLSELNFKKADKLGMNPVRFTRKFREAALEKGAKCLSSLEQIPGAGDLRGFERVSFGRLKQRCQQ